MMSKIEKAVVKAWKIIILIRAISTKFQLRKSTEIGLKQKNKFNTSRPQKITSTAAKIVITITMITMIIIIIINDQNQ